MKRLSLLLVVIFMVSMAWATIDEYYSFTATTGTYTPITGTAVTDMLSDDAISAAIPIGFTFVYGDNSYTEVKISSNGWIGLGTAQTGSNLSNALNSTTVVPVVAPLWDDLSMAAGTCQYLVSGTAPNRIFTIQYADAKWNYGATSLFNYQVKLYENGKIELVYGSSTGAPSSASASIGINMLPGGPGWFFSVTPGAPATASTTVANTAIAEFPAQGTIYQFNPVVAQANDLSVLSLTGSTTPTVGILSPYVVTVRNRGTASQSVYQVKLLNGTAEIGSVAGTVIAPNQNLAFTINWTPTVAGPASLIGKVVLAGDQNTTNDQSNPMAVTVQPAGVQAVTIGAGDQTARVPMDFYWKNSLFECIYTADELGFVTGTITSLAFYNNFVTSNPNGATKIWLGSTTQTDLSGGWIPSTQMTLVFDGNVIYPSGANTITIPLSTPYMHTPGNLVMMVNRPMDTVYYSSSDYFQTQTIGTSRALAMQSDSTLFDPAAPTGGTLSGIFPKTTIFYTGQAITNDMGCLSVTGNVTPSVGSVSNYVVTVKNNGTATQTNYSVKLMKEGNVEIASVAGTSINSLQTLTFTLPWTPSVTGPTYVYGKVVMANDEIAQNNQTTNLNVVVQAAGVVAVTVGNGGSTGRMPVDMFYKNSLFETMYLASELNIGGLLTGIQFYNSFATNLPNMPTNIWVGETTQTDLSAGWIPSTQLTQVFTGNVNYPSGSNNVLVQLTTPYAYGGGNLVVMVERPMDTQYYSSSDVFVTQTGTLTGRTRNAYSDSVDFDPAAPPAATAQGMFPKTTFMFITENMGALNGTVTVGGAPLEGATVSIVGTPAVQITNAAGQYSFPYVFEGAQQVNATKHGYTSVTNNVTIIEDQTVTSNFVLALLPQVTVSGMVVGSDQPTVGLVGATINLTGYEPYTATTTAGGLFTIPNVFASQTYNYTVTYAGYTNATGTAVVGTTNLNMGTITVNEIALPATQVVATEAANFSNVVVNWSEPGTAGGEWLSYCGDNDDSIGTGGVADFDVAIRFPASALTDYAGMSLYSVKVWPAQAGSFSLRVWTGGSATAPGPMVVDQAFTPVLDQYNEVVLATPVPLVAGQELWFGYRCNVTSGYPAGCDAGPQDEGLGNMMYYQGAWTTLAALAPTLTYNWNIEGYVGYSAPTRGAALVPLAFNAERYNTGTLATSGVRKANNTISTPQNNDRVRVGYKVYRLLAADQANEANWTTLTPNPITPLTYTDNAWQPLPSGVYKYAVKAAYTNGVLAPAAFSNSIHKGMMGTLTGTVTDVGTGAPVADAIITAGEYSGTSNASGVYSFGVYQGVYTVTCVKGGYQPASQPAVTITGLQTTTQNFALAEIALAPTQVVSEQVQNNTVVNLSWMPPDPNAANVSEDFEGTAFPPEDWTQIITDTSAAGTTGVLPTWCSIGTVALTPEVPPHGGALQAALWWSYNHQDEWLITPQFSCPPASALNFWSYVFFGSTNDDHYWVKVSTDNGATWTSLWDATAQTGGWNYYATPINIDLASYAGQQIKLAFHADDPPSADGLWYVWFIDDITVGNDTTTLAFATDQLTSISAATSNRIVEGTSNIPAVASRAALSKGARPVVEPVLESTYSYNPSRALVGYKAWRLLQGQETNEAVWTSLTPNTITATGLQDTGWAGVPDGTYKWAVKAVYTGNVLSVPAFSNPQTKLTQVGTIAGLVRNPQNQGIAGATVVCGTVTATTNASGAYSMTVGAGTVNVTASANGYTAVTQTGIVVVTGQTTTVNFTLPVSQVILSDGFETYPNFTLTFAPWTLVDVDMSTTYGMTGITWENAYAAMAFMVFNPSATTPAVTDFAAQEGSKMAACFASTTPPNNDWLITPQIAGGGEIKFWARSYVSTYGLERFKVGVSTTGTAPANFAIISGTNHVEAPVDWTEYTYSLASYAGQQIYVGIQCISNDAFIFGVDNVRANGGASDDPTAPVLSTQLYGNYPNPFNPETTIRYSVKDASPVTIGVYNLKGQLVKTLVNDTKAAGNYNVVWNGTDNSGRAVSSGVYYYKMYAGKFSSTRKMILMK